MSDDMRDEKRDEPETRSPEEPMSSTQSTPPKKRSVVLRVFGWSVPVLLAGMILLAAGATWYTNTPDFQRRVGREVVRTLEDATGGRVELRHLSFSLWRLAIEADGLVIHGSEAPGERPYLSASKIFLRLQLNVVLTHIRGLGPQSRISLRYLRIEEPSLHLMVDKDGHTNVPTPKHPRTGNQPLSDTLLDLQARKVELVNGLAVLNDRAIPFDLAARNVSAEVRYLRQSDRYGAMIDLADLRTRMDAEPEMQSRLRMTAEMGRDQVAVTRLEFWSGGADGAQPAAKDGATEAAHLVAQARLEHFAHPQWTGTVAGSLGVRQLKYLADVQGLKDGTIDLNLSGHNCLAAGGTVAPVKRRRFWQRLGRKHAATSALATTGQAATGQAATGQGDCSDAIPAGSTAGFVVAGAMKVHGFGYQNEYVRLHDIEGGTQLRATPSELRFTDMSGYLPQGGGAKGELRIEHWLSSQSAEAPTRRAKAPTESSHAYLTATVDHIPLRTVMEMVAPANYGDLGFDTSITGPATVEWGDPSSPHVADTVQVNSQLKFAPVGLRRRGVGSNVPLTGEVLGHYDGRLEVVNIAHLTLRSRSASLVTSGVLGVDDGDPLTNLRVNLRTEDLGEFDQLLRTLGFEANGRKGTAAIPVVLHGPANFVGTVSGPVLDLDVNGHVVANDLVLRLGDLSKEMADVPIDSVVGSAEYSPNGGLRVASSTIKHGTAVLHAEGTVTPRRAMERGKPVFVWDKDLAIDGSAQLSDAQAVDLLEMVGQQKKIPVTGTVDFDLNASGTMHHLIGGGTVTLLHGAAYGENYQKIAVRMAAEGEQVSLTQVLLVAHGLSIRGSAGYNLATRRISGQVRGENLSLAKFDTVRRVLPGDDGVLSFTAISNGTFQQPDLHARLSLQKISVQGKRLGDLEAKADSTGSNLLYELHSRLVGAQVYASGQTSLVDGYQTQAKMTMNGLDVGNVIKLLAPESFQGRSAVTGTISLSGPVARPEQMVGSAQFNDVDFKLQGIELKAAQPLRVSLRDGVATLDPLHVIGQDTDLYAMGTAVVFGDSNPLGGRIDLTANGSVSMTLASTLDPDLSGSGKVMFKVAADGRMKKPALTGDVRVQHVNLLMEGVANGLNDMNGTLVFNEDRLDVQDLTATTGGGLLRIGGYLAYENGIYVNLTATGDVVRVRYNGLSATANADLRLQGVSPSMLLSGEVQVTRFGVGQNVDFSALSSAGAVQAPSSLSSPTNNFRLDVHITSSPQLNFQNSFARLAGSVDLTVSGTLAAPSMLGQIQIIEGSAKYLGTEYELERGTITFNNPVRINPTIDLDATARVEDYDITIGVHGTMGNLKPSYRSEPPLTESDIFNLLALGRTQEESQLYQDQEEQPGTSATSTALLGGALNAAVQSRVGKLFGAGSVNIDPAFIGTLGESAARITVTEPLTKQVTLVFATNVNETEEQLIQVSYQLNQEYSIVVTRDESDVYSVVFKIRKRYR